MSELPSETGLAPPENSKKRRRLVILVITLGVLLVLGFATMVGTIIYRISNRDSQQNDLSTVDAARLQAELRPRLQFKRPAGTELIGVTSSGNHMTFHFQDDQGDIVIVFDLASGKVISRVDIPATK